MHGLIRKAWDYAVRRGGPAAIEITVNLVLPYIVFSLTQKRLGDVRALMVSSAPPVVWSIVEFLRHRRVDALSLFVLLGIVLSLLVFVGGGSVHVLQLREKLVTVAVGAVFLGSAAIGKPLVYELARASMIRKGSSEIEAFEARRNNPGFRRAMTVMTLVWGFGLLTEAAVSTGLIYAVSVRDYLIVGPLFGYGTLGGLALWTVWYVRRQKRRSEARLAADAQRTP